MHLVTQICCAAAVLVLSSASGALAQSDMPAQPAKPAQPAAKPADKPAADLDAPPPIFAKMTLDEALKSIEGTDKILVVKATAAWCAPCKAMDRTTWRDDKVIQWFKDNGVVIALDVDKKPADSKKLKIAAMPTMVAFRGGKELDRVAGMRSADQLITWLEAAKRGEKESSTLRKKAEPGPNGEVNVDARYALARQLLQEGEHEKAAAEYVWLWDNMVKLNPSMVGVRGSFMASDMERLARASAPAKAQFVTLRDAAEKRASTPETADATDDFIVLNKVVGDEDRTLAWFDRVKADPAAAPALMRSSFRIEELLDAKGRWQDLGKYVYAQPREVIDRMIEMNRITAESASKAPSGMQAMMKSSHEEMFKRNASRVYAALLAAKRDTEADEAIAAISRNDPGGMVTITCIVKALEIGEAREAMRKHIDGARLKGVKTDGYIRTLDKALGK